jgi:pimeloyl-ACP methyl ester carboxylesterase
LETRGSMCACLSAFASVVTVRLAVALPSTMAAARRGETKERGARNRTWHYHPIREAKRAKGWLGFDNKHTVAIHPQLKQLQVPTLIVWGLKDIFFDKKWAYRLKDTIPGAKRVVEVEDARLFFPEDRPDEFATPLNEFWNEFSVR